MSIGLVSFVVVDVNTLHLLWFQYGRGWPKTERSHYGFTSIK
jgi:hypothetical protein